ncbi:hypothetical protein V6N13_058208 [Hibiscus sabdariffa]
MPSGLKNAGTTYQRAMVTLFHDMMHKETEVYVDDMIAKSQTEEEHITNLRKLFERLRKFQLKLNPAKCTFGVASGKLLGFVVSKRGIEVDPDKIKAIQELPPPRTQKEEAFDKVKQYLSNPPVLVPPVPGRPLILYLAIFENSMGCVLGQHDETERKELRQYMLYRTTWLISKIDPIKYMMESPGLSRRLARWQILHSEYDIEYVSQKAIKGSAIADFLASRILAEYEHLSFDFPDEDLICQTVSEEGRHTEKPWRMNFDGASNAHGHGIGAILVSLEGDHYPFTGRLNFECTNNVAEYEACIMGLYVAIQREIEILEVYSDSSLVIYQLRGEWETRDTKLARYRKLVLELIKEFKRISFHYFPREDNQMADALATLTSMFKANREADMMPIQMSIHDSPASCNVIEDEVDDRPWYYDILQYIKCHKYPKRATENDKRTIRRMAMGYVLDGRILYRRASDQTLLRCVESHEAKKIIEEVHEGTCGIHANGFIMSRQIMSLVTPSCYDGSMAIFNVGHGCDRDNFTKSIKWTPFYFRDDRLLHKMGGSCLVRKRNQINGAQVPQKGNHLSVWSTRKDYL